MANTLGDNLNDILQDAIKLANDREEELEQQIYDLNQEVMKLQEELSAAEERIENDR